MIIKMRMDSVTRLINSCLLLVSLSSSVYAENKSLEKLIAKTIGPQITKQQIPGIAIAIYYNGQDYYFNYGYADREKNSLLTKILFSNSHQLLKFLLLPCLLLRSMQPTLN